MITNIASQRSVNQANHQDLAEFLPRVLELYPDHSPAHHDLARAYYQNGDNDRALMHFEKAVNLDPENTDYKKSLADFYYSVAGRVEDALEIYFKVLDRQPRNLEVLLMAGHLCVTLNKFDDAEEYYRRVLEIEPWNRDAGQLIDKLKKRCSSGARPASAEEQHADIQTMITTGRQNEAIDALEALLASHSDFALAHNDLGVLYYNRGDKENALKGYETAARLEPDNITFQKNLADFYYVEQGKMEDALKIYVKILESNPEDAEILLILGHFCVALQKFDDAEEFYKRLLAVEPWNAEAHENLDKLTKRPTVTATETSPDEEYGKIMAQVERDDGEVINQLENLLLGHPRFAAAHNDLGVLYYNREEKDKALHHYERAAQLEPQNPNFQKNLADFYFVEAGRVEDALQIYNNVLAVDPLEVEALMSMGMICEALERPEDARHFYNRVLEAEPWNVDARNQLENLNIS